MTAVTIQTSVSTCRRFSYNDCAIPCSWIAYKHTRRRNAVAKRGAAARIHKKVALGLWGSCAFVCPYRKSQSFLGSHNMPPSLWFRTRWPERVSPRVTLNSGTILLFSARLSRCWGVTVKWLKICLPLGFTPFAIYTHKHHTTNLQPRCKSLQRVCDGRCAIVARNFCDILRFSCSFKDSRKAIVSSWAAFPRLLEWIPHAS